MIYKILINVGYEKAMMKNRWQEDLEEEVKSEDWNKIWSQRIMKNMSIRVKENCYKVGSRWYLTPTGLNIINKNVPSQCWRSKKEKGSNLPMWWTCEVRKKEWALVFKEIRETVFEYRQLLSF